MIIISGTNVNDVNVVYEKIKKHTNIKEYSSTIQNPLTYSVEDHYNEKELLTHKNELIKLTSSHVYSSNFKFADALIYVISKPFQINNKPNFNVPMFNNNNQDVYFVKQLRDISKWITKAKKSMFIIEIENFNSITQDLSLFLLELIPELTVSDFEPIVSNKQPSLLETETQAFYDMFIQKQFKDIISFYNDKNLFLKLESFECKRTKAITNWSMCQECLNNKNKKDQLKQRAKNLNIDWNTQPCLYECKYNVGNKLISEQQSIENNSWFDKDKETYNELLKDVTNRKFLYSMHFPEASSLLMNNKFEEAIAIINVHMENRKQFLK